MNNQPKIEWQWSIIAEFMGRIGPLVIFFAYARFLGSDAVGEVLVVYSYAISAWLFINLGLGTYGAKLAAENSKSLDLVQLEITLCRFLLSLLVSVFFVLITIFLLNAKIWIVLAFVIFLIGRSVATDWKLRGQAKFISYAKVMFFASVFQLAAAAFFVREDNWNYTLAMPWAIYAMTVFIGTWYFNQLSRFEFVNLNIRNSISHIKRSIGFSLSNGVSVIYQQSPVLIMSAIQSPAAIAGFALLHRFLLSGVLLFQVIGNAVFPVLIKQSKRSNLASLKITYSFVKITIVIASVIIGLILCILYYFDFQEAYLPGLSLSTTLFLLSFYLLRCIRVPFVKHSFAAGMEKKYAKVNLAVLFLYILVAFLLFNFHLLSQFSISMIFFIGELAILLGLIYFVVNSKVE